MRDTLIISQEEIPALLPMSECISVVRDALVELATGGGIQPLRPIMWLPDRVGALGMMPGYLPSLGLIGIKTISVFPGNEGTAYDSHQGTVMLFGDEDGALLAVIDATEITAIRTAAASAVATDALARADTSVLAVLGTGVQARSHIEAIPLVRRFTEIRIWGRSPGRAAGLADTATQALGGPDIRPAGSVAEAVSGADVVCTTTAATEPVLPGALLEPGVHINAVGSSVPHARELEGEVVARSRLFVDRRESALTESGDFLMAREEGLVTDNDIVAELGEVLSGATPGRQAPDEITLFKSLGIAVEDVAAGSVVYENAIRADKGTRIALGGRRRA